MFPGWEVRDLHATNNVALGAGCDKRGAPELGLEVSFDFDIATEP